MTTATNNITLLNLALAWHKENGPKPIPTWGMGYDDDVIIAHERLYESEHVRVPPGYSHDPASAEWSKKDLVLIESRAIPLVSGALSGFSQEELVKIYEDHDLNIDDFLQSFRRVKNGFLRPDGSTIDGREIFRKCLVAIASKTPAAIYNEYVQCSDNDSFTMMALTLSPSPHFWPSTILNDYAKFAKGEDDNWPHRNLVPSLFSFTDELTSTACVPHDENGPRFDWFLERSGMISPIVTQKSLGYFCAWEDLVYLQGEDSCPAGAKALFEYCIDNPTPHVRDGILQGLRSLCVDSAENVIDSMRLLRVLSEILPGTWLEPVLDSSMLILSSLGHENPQRTAEAINNKPAPLATLWEKPAEVHQRVYDEFLSIPAPSLPHLNALSYLMKVHCEQIFRDDFRREDVIVHMVKAIQSLPGGGREANTLMLCAEDARAECRKTLKDVARSLRGGKEFDYQALKGLDSASVKVLVEEGFDIHKLPRMSHKDRGRLVEQDLGM
ncbi:hypothetical protein [Pseudomonas putida]|uniref:Uncharacterized protein n=1 Tax=Pseudomonas putida TaxID=303 RepID=A0A8I1EC45_PSEPU|nr:hypothetical protein [Pseudomonas putida]MBI6882632.1 hypothetical protein [Pseudomonas putida]